MSTPTHADDTRMLAPDAPIGEAVGWAVAHAVHAPRELNSQPWSFRATVDRLGTTAVVELLPDASRLLLTARTAGLSASSCNAALHVPELRGAVGRAVGLDHPQVLLRLGYAPQDLPVARRTVRDVLHVTS